MMILVLLSSILIVGLILTNFHRLKDFQPFNSWLVLFTCLLLVFPLLSAFLLLDGFLGIISELPIRTLRAITIPSLFGGVGLFLLFNSIRKMSGLIALSLFAFTASLAFGILFEVHFAFWLIPLLLLITAVITFRTISSHKVLGFKDFALPLFAGFASIGFIKAFQVEPQTISGLVQSFGNDTWQVYLFQLILIAVASGIFVFPIFLAQMGQKNAWIYYDTPFLGKNILTLFALSLLVFIALFLSVYASMSLN